MASKQHVHPQGAAINTSRLRRSATPPAARTLCDTDPHLSCPAPLCQGVHGCAEVRHYAILGRAHRIAPAARVGACIWAGTSEWRLVLHVNVSLVEIYQARIELAAVSGACMGSCARAGSRRHSADTSNPLTQAQTSGARQMRLHRETVLNRNRRDSHTYTKEPAAARLDWRARQLGELAQCCWRSGAHTYPQQACP